MGGADSVSFAQPARGPSAWHLFEGAIDPGLCDTITRLGEELQSAPATVNRRDSSAQPTIDPAHRRGPVAFFRHDHWIGDLLLKFVHRANASSWNLRVLAHQPVQYSVYHAGDFYDWHKDALDDGYPADHEAWPGLNRRLSLSLNLSDPQSYVGGDLIFRDSAGRVSSAVEGFRSRGSILIFPSFTEHTASRVTDGIRRALVLWALGPSP